MEDKLHQAYDAWKKTVTDPVEFQTFQGGFTAGAVSMRERAMKEISKAVVDGHVKDADDLTNAIGALPDVAP
jgi:hypothetical protein